MNSACYAHNNHRITDQMKSIAVDRKKIIQYNLLNWNGESTQIMWALRRQRNMFSANSQNLQICMESSFSFSVLCYLHTHYHTIKPENVTCSRVWSRQHTLTDIYKHTRWLIVRWLHSCRLCEKNTIIAVAQMIKITLFCLLEPYRWLIIRYDLRLFALFVFSINAAFSALQL